MNENAEIYYPSEKGTIRSVAEYREKYLAQDLDVAQLGQRTLKSLELAERATSSQRSGRWLDYGSGAGVFVYHLANRLSGWTIEGWDADSSSIILADSCFARPNARYRLLEQYEAYEDIEPGTFDGVSLLEVIEHVPNTGDLLVGLGRALRSGGHILISTPYCLGYSAVSVEVRRCINEWIGRRDRKAVVGMINNMPYNPAIETGHVAIYNVPTLATILKLTGYDLVDFCFAANGRGLAARMFPDTVLMLARKS